MKLVYGVVTLVFFIQILACKNTGKEPSPQILYNIDADNIHDIIDLKLSNIADSFRLIPLESTKGCLLDNHTEYYVNERYILAYSENGGYKFSSEGKFIKKLFGRGRGPQEFFGLAGFCNFVVDDKKDLLYISDQMRRNEFLVYDIISENFLDPVKKYIPGSNFFGIYNDSTLIVANSSYIDSSNYAVYFQNLKGEFISGITHNKRILYNQAETSQPSRLSVDSTNYYVSFIRDDTLYKLKENQLVPYMALNFNIPGDNPPSRTKKKGDRRIIFPDVEAQCFILIQIIITEEMIWYSSESGEEKLRNTYLFYNKITGKTTKVNTYTDDFIGKTQDVLKLSQIVDGGYLDFPAILPDRKLIVAYYPYQIKEAIEKGLNYKDFPGRINEQLLKLNEKIQETDNPILLVGKIKNKI